MSKVAGERQRQGVRAGDGDDGEGTTLGHETKWRELEKMTEKQIGQYETKTQQFTLDIGVTTPTNRQDTLKSPQRSCRISCNKARPSMGTRPLFSGHITIVDAG